MGSILGAASEFNVDSEEVEDMNNSAVETPRLSLSKAPSLDNMLDDGTNTSYLSRLFLVWLMIFVN